jgi:hypothetical protein
LDLSIPRRRMIEVRLDGLGRTPVDLSPVDPAA